MTKFNVPVLCILMFLLSALFVPTGQLDVTPRQNGVAYASAGEGTGLS